MTHKYLGDLRVLNGNCAIDAGLVQIKDNCGIALWGGSLGNEEYSGELLPSEGIDTNTLGFANALGISSDGDWDNANAISGITKACRGLSLFDGDGNGKRILLKGFIRNDAWPAWTVNEEVYLARSNGALTQTLSGVFLAGDIVQRVGWAYGTKVIYFDPGTPEVLTAPYP